MFSVALALTCSPAPAIADNVDQFEGPAVLDAANILPPKLMRGPHHQVQPPVMNDGYVNTYTIKSAFGSFTAVGNAMLEIRVNEIHALVAMQEIQQTDAYTAAFEEAADDLGRGAKNLVADPLGTVGNAVSGVAKLFGRASEVIIGDRSRTEGSRFESLVGFSNTKREYAHEFGVDVYSSNPVLQEHLDDISWAGYGGGLTFGLATMVVPGAAGMVVTGVSTTDLMSETFRVMTPIDLRQMNREKLAAMGVSSDLSDIFIGNAHFSPRHQTLLVAALEAMEGVAGRAAFIKVALHASDEDAAFFRQRYAQMLAGYHRNVGPFDSMISFGSLVVGKTAEGTIVATPPLDHLTWTSSAALVASELNTTIDALPRVEAKELWLEGTVSSLARQQLQSMGWRVQENAGKTLYAE